MAKVDIVWAESARADLYSLIEPLRSNAPKRALKLMDQLVKALGRLADFPESGRRPSDVTTSENVRELVIEQLRVFYSFDNMAQSIQIIAVFSARQNVEELFRTRFNPNE